MPGMPADRYPRVDKSGTGVAARVEKHGTRRCGRGRLAKIDEGLAAIGHADQHEAAAAQISGFRKGHGQRISRGDRRIDRIPALPEHCDTDLAREPMRRDDHAALGPLRYRRGGLGAARRQHEQHERRDLSAMKCSAGQPSLRACRNETGGKAEAFPPDLLSAQPLSQKLILSVMYQKAPLNPKGPPIARVDLAICKAAHDREHRVGRRLGDLVRAGIEHVGAAHASACTSP